MDGSIKKITVVGGGTAGWLCAAFMQRMLNRNDPRRVEISLIESPDIGIIGVGEATVPTLVHMLRFLGIDEAEFMRKTHATYKQAIRFINWRDSPSVAPDNYYYHPFDRPPMVDELPAHLALSASLPDMDATRFAYGMSYQPWMCDANRSPKVGQDTVVGYAYHLDAVLLGRYLREISTGRGVIHIEDKVESVTRRPDGGIGALHTQAGRVIESDLYIDCSGFNSVLLQGVFNEPFVSYKDNLFCDRAVAMQVPMDVRDDITSYTKATAMSSGWTWEIQLRDRKGIGHVYASDFVSDEDAERELRKYVGEKSEGLNSRILKMKVGRSENFWVKNCVGIGLSSGFIEPLESTGIYLVEVAIKTLLDNLSLDGTNEACVRNYNRLMRQNFDEIRDFIVLHYCLTNREDTEFWRANKFNKAIPERLKENLMMWEKRYPSPFDDALVGSFFNHVTYLYILAGMGKLPKIDSSYSGFVDPEKIKRGMMNFEKQKDMVLKAVPSHREYLENTFGPFVSR